MIAASDPVLPHPERLRAQALGLLSAWGVDERRARVRVQWNARLATAAGRVDLIHAKISLNPRLLARVPGAVAQVLAHEAAHLAVVWLFGPAAPPHGAAWQKLMRDAGYEPRACHDYPIAGLERRAFWYLHLCAGCGTRVIRRRPLQLHCGRCGPSAEILRMRAPRHETGYASLRRMSVDEARRLRDG